LVGLKTELALLGRSISASTGESSRCGGFSAERPRYTSPHYAPQCYRAGRIASAFLWLEDGIALRAPGFCNTNQLFDVNSEQAATD